MFVEFWPVNTSVASLLSFPIGKIPEYLLEDWIPTLPVSAGRSVMGWPFKLLKVTSYESGQVLSLDKVARGAERQWKGFVSWMLGVAGARHFLGNGGYRWIAPAGAFYSNAVQPVTLKKWPTTLPPGRVEVKRPNGSKQLLPDYLVLRLYMHNIRRRDIQ